MAVISTEYGHDTTAAEVARGIDLSGRRIIVTGGASGIGVETARALAGTGADVTLAVRDLAAGERTAGEIIESTGNSDVRVEHLDLADRASVAAFVAAWTGPLHVLVNNAGVMASPETRTPEGWELQFATNHLGHFALALGLHDALAADGAGAHRRGQLRGAPPLSRRVRGHPLRAARVRPVAGLRPVQDGQRAVRGRGDAPLGRRRHHGQRAHAGRDRDEPPALHGPGGRRRLVEGRGHRRHGLKTPEQGAATSVLLATSPALAGVSGRYFEDCNEAPVVANDSESSSGVRAYALDPEAAKRLWEVSTEMLASPLRHAG